MQKNNLKLVTLIQNGISVEYNLERLYSNNLGFITQISQQYCIPGDDVELYKDLMQVAFFAVYDAAVKFDFKKSNNFLTYLRYWLIHYFHEESIRICFPVSIPDNEYYKVKKLGRLADFRAVDLSYLEQKDVIEGIVDGSLIYTIHYEDYHLNTLAKDFWALVKSTLTEMNYEIIVFRFRDKLSYSEIGNYYGIGKERVRKRIVNSLFKLRHNVKIQIIAEDWYGINVQRCLDLENEKWASQLR